jgi:hypothetical protein
MATASFDKSFDITDTESAELIRKGLASPRIIKVIERNYDNDNEKGIQLLKQRFSAFQKR